MNRYGPNEKPNTAGDGADEPVPNGGFFANAGTFLRDGLRCIVTILFLPRFIRRLRANRCPLPACRRCTWDILFRNTLKLDNRHVRTPYPQIPDWFVDLSVRFQNLRVIKINIWTFKSRELPEDIGSLTNLIELSIPKQTITSVPSSIGHLRNLQTLKLDLYLKENATLPEEIGDLARLKSLDLAGSWLGVLPSSIGRLINLEYLDLSFTDITRLPPEIGDLINLNTLDLQKSQIDSIPSSVGQLKNLEKLFLQYTPMVALPEEVGNLHSLVELNIAGRRIVALPFDSLRRLPNLRWIWISNWLEFPRDEAVRLKYAICCNRARFNTGLGIEDENKLFPRILELWPRLLAYPYDPFLIGSKEDHYPPLAFDMTESDAIFQLLLDGREAFLRLLIDRTKK